MKIGMIGAGAIARVHAETLKNLPDVELGSVYDMDEGKAQSFSLEWGIKMSSSLETTLEESDAVYINVPNRFHAEITLAALQRQCHVFCEKPFALHLGEASDIANAVEKAGVIYQLGFNRRFAPVYQKMKEFFPGEGGKEAERKGGRRPFSFNIKMNRGELQNPPWTSNSQVTGGFLFESTLHLLDMVRFLMGEVKKVTAVGSKSVYPCVDNFSMIFEMESGTHGVFSSCAHTSWIYPFERVELYGEHCSITNEEMEAVSYCEGLNSPILGERFSTLPLSVRWGYQKENEIFVNRLLGKPPMRKDYADHLDGLRNVELMENIYQSIGLGR